MKNFYKSSYSISYNTILKKLGVGLWLGMSLLSGNTSQGNHKPIPIQSEGNPFGFYEYLPLTYREKPKQRWPVVICWHGNGKRGDGSLEQLAAVLGSGPALHIEEGKQYPAIIISPQTPQKWPTVNELEQFVLYIKNRYSQRMNHQKLYIMGQSMGGGFTWNIAQKRPDLIAAIVPICGASKINGRNTNGMVGMGIWAFHNDRDPTVSPSNTINWINSINQAGGSTRKTIFNSNKHDCWSRVYDDPMMWDWLFKQKLKTSALPTHAPQLEFTHPKNGQHLSTNGQPKINITSTDKDGWIRTVKLFINQSFVDEDNIYPYSFDGDYLNTTLKGKHFITVAIQDNDEKSSYSKIELKNGVVKATTEVYAENYAGMDNLPSNTPPISDAGPNQTLVDYDQSGTESVTLNGGGSIDHDGFISSYQWSQNGIPFSHHKNPFIELTTGKHNITLTVTDNEGAKSSDVATIFITDGETEIDQLPYTQGFEQDSPYKGIVRVPTPNTPSNGTGSYSGEMYIKGTQSQSKSSKAYLNDLSIDLNDADKVFISGKVGLRSPELGTLKIRCKLKYSNGKSKSSGWYHISPHAHKNFEPFKKRISLNGDESFISGIEIQCKQTDQNTPAQILLIDDFRIE